MTVPQWQLDRRPPRKQTPPSELKAEACRKCGHSTLVADVGTAVVNLKITAVPGYTPGFRWHPATKEWQPTTIATEPNGHLIWALHECRGRNNKKESKHE